MGCDWFVRGVGERAVQLTAVTHVALFHADQGITWTEGPPSLVEIGATFRVREDTDELD